jgi:AcrR family transcriptional regulator
MFAHTDDRSLADRRRDATRDGILAAAWQICRRDGLGALSLRELGRSVGLKASSLYAYFDSKSAIYDAMFRQGYEQLEELSETWDRTLRPDEPARIWFKRASHELFEFCTSDPVRYQLMFQRVLPDFEPTPETYAVSVRQLERLGRTLAELGVTDPGAMDLWTAIATGLTDQQISNDPGGDRWRRLVDTAVDLFCDHVGIPPKGATP